MLSGVTASEEMSAIAHSDGDVVLHAIVDAVLGALGAGDIGERFPNTDPRWKGAASRVFLEEVWEEAAARGLELANLDVTILAERPKIKPLKPRMLASLADILKVPEDRLNIKAGTNEGCDAIGRGEAIASHAVVLLAPAALH